MSLNIRGQDTLILLVREGQPDSKLDAVVDFEFTIDFDILWISYLSDTTPRTDLQEFFRGVTFSGTIHLQSRAWFAFQYELVQRARREIPSFVVNVSTVLTFPDGSVAKVLVPDAKFGPQPVSVRGRNNYVFVKVTGAADEYFATAS